MRVHSSIDGDTLSLREFMSGLRTQARVINALMLRDTKTRFGRHKLGFFWMFMEPVFFVILFLGFKILISSPTSGGMPDAYFIVVGITPFLLFRQCMSSLGSSIAASRSLLAFPQVTTFDVMMSSALLEFVTILFVFAAMLTGCALFWEPYAVENPLLVLYGTLLLGISGTGAGMVFASLAPIFPSVSNFSNQVFGRPLFFTSGVFFTADMLPSNLREYALYNPILHMIEMIRSGFFIEFESPYVDYNFAGIFAVSMLLLGLMTHQVLRNVALKLA